MIFYRKFFFCAEGAIQLVGYLPGIQEAMGSIPASHMPSMMNTCDQEYNFILSYR